MRQLKIILTFLFIIFFTLNINSNELTDMGGGLYSYRGANSLMRAIKRLDKDKNNYINDKTINGTDNEGWTPLMYALYFKYFALAYELIEQGADINMINNSGWNAFMYFILKYDSYHVDENEKLLLKVFLEKTDDLNNASVEGRTALMLAVRYKTSTIINKLLENGADINHLDIYGNNCLMYAIKSNKYIIDYLIEMGININYKNYLGDSPLLYSVKKSKEEISEKLILNGADINFQDSEGKSILIIEAIKDKCNVELISFFLENGADPNIIDLKGKTVIDYAEQKKNKRLIKLLNEAGAKRGSELIMVKKEERYGKIKINISNGKEGIVKLNNLAIGKTGEIIIVTEGFHTFVIEYDKNISLFKAQITADQVKSVTDPIFISKKDLNNRLGYTSVLKQYKYDIRYTVGSIFGLISAVFPVTNLIGFPYYITQMSRFASIFIAYPLGVPSFLCLSASIVTFAVGYYYYYDKSDMDVSRGLFIGSGVTIGLSYLINLVVGIVVFAFDTYNFGDFKKNKIHLEKTKLRLLENLIINVSQEEVDISYKIRL